MTKICPNCGTENQDSSEFCQNCGNKMGGTVKTSQPNKSTKTGFMGWWDKQTKGIKALSIIGVCCLGLIVIAAIGGTLLPAKTTTNVSTPSTNTTPTQSNTPASSTMSDSDFLNDMSDWANTMSTTEDSAAQTDNNYAQGTEDTPTTISDLQGDISQVNSVTSDMDSITPPAKYQEPYNLTLTAYQEIGQAMQDAINGLNDNDPSEITQGTTLTNDAISKVNQASEEINQTS